MFFIRPEKVEWLEDLARTRSFAGRSAAEEVMRRLRRLSREAAKDRKTAEYFKRTGGCQMAEIMFKDAERFERAIGPIPESAGQTTTPSPK